MSRRILSKLNKKKEDKFLRSCLTCRQASVVLINSCSQQSNSVLIGSLLILLNITLCCVFEEFLQKQFGTSIFL